MRTTGTTGSGGRALWASRQAFARPVPDVARYAFPTTCVLSTSSHRFPDTGKGSRAAGALTRHLVWRLAKGAGGGPITRGPGPTRLDSKVDVVQSIY
jgi:hypothetical protein